jgi:DNA-directed RNA polymerase specialized sigma24 family protein
VTVEAAERFEQMRPALVHHAYRMLGDYGEAEDVVQDAYLRRQAALENDRVEDDWALSRTIVTRLCLERLRSARAKREVYVGPWGELLRVRDALLAALQNDDPAALDRLLTDDVVFTSDGGGKVPSATVPVAGRERVTKLLFGLKEKPGWRNMVRMELVSLNGMSGIVAFTAQSTQEVVALEIAGGRVAAMYVCAQSRQAAGRQRKADDSVI